MLKTQKQAEKKRLVNFKVTKEQHAEIKAKAKKYAKGNVTAWIRYAATTLDARTEDLVK